MTHIQAVREAMIKVVPEIMESKFGCLAKGGVVNIGDGYWVAPGEGMVDTSDGLEILGRPIRLADILSAIPIGRCNLWQSVDKKDHLCISDKIGAFYWNLRKDSLELQEEKTVEFLYSILCK